MLRLVNFGVKRRLTNFKFLSTPRFYTTGFLPTRDELLKDGVIPDVVNDFTPQKPLDLTFKTTFLGEFKLIPGSQVKPETIKDKPILQFEGEKGKYYTLVLVDADIPSRAERKPESECLLWLVSNIPGEDITKGDEWVEYVPPYPEKFTGLHRYVLAMYQHDQKIDLSNEPKIDKNTEKGRKDFSLRKFADKYKFNSPIAITYFKSDWDAYVPKIYEQLGIPIKEEEKKPDFDEIPEKAQPIDK